MSVFEPSVTLPDHLDGASGRWFLFDRQGQLLLVDERPLVATEPLPGVEGVHVLGTDADGPVWAGRLGDHGSVPEDATLVDLRRAFSILSEDEWVMAGRAAQVLTWERDHKHCGRCGAEAEVHPSERASRCPGCGLMGFPRLTPAIITLVERDDGKALLGWGRQFPGRFFSALAGFVEPGETLEQCVAREVKEEAGIDVRNIRYFGSQPWPFPHSLMVGFNADYAGGELVIQESEIVEADWFAPDELPPVPRGRMSIAGWLIEDWIERTSG